MIDYSYKVKFETKRWNLVPNNTETDSEGSPLNWLGIGQISVHNLRIGSNQMGFVIFFKHFQGF